MYGFIYVWFDRKHRRFYVGSHWGTESDGYVCSSKWMKRAYKRRPQDFKRRIIMRMYENQEKLLNEEHRWLQMIKKDELGTRYYNLRNHRFGHWSECYDKQTMNEKISTRTKEAMQRPDVRGKYLKGLAYRDNRSSELEVREKRRQSMREAMIKKYGTLEARLNSSCATTRSRARKAIAQRMETL